MNNLLLVNSHKLSLMKPQFILFILSLILTSTFALAQTATAPSSGDGTSGNPYQISSLNNLYWITQSTTRWSNYYSQTANIDASSSSTWDSGAGFIPIGNTSTQFTGEYNGNGRTITGLTIDRSSTDYIGMFGYANGADIINVTLIDADISGDDKVGALVGYAINTDIINSSTSGTVTGSGTEVGGLVGGNLNGTHSENFSSASVTGNGSTGGLIGFNWGGRISKSYATGTVSGGTSGGLVGLNSYLNSTLTASITDSYASGNVTGSTLEGGLVGENDSDGGGNSPPITTSYFNTTNGGPDNGVGTGLTTTEMRVPSSFTGFDFTNDWEQIYRVHFPVLQNNTPSSLPGMVSFAGGDGSSGNPYQISTIDQLHAIRADLNDDYILITDLDLSTATGDPAGDYWNSGEGWTPIGDTFFGDLDGNGYIITGLFVDRIGNAGLFSGTGNGSNIFDLTLESVDITGTIHAGGLVGSQGGVVTRVQVSGSVSSSNTAGGISGLMTKTLSNSYSSVTVSGTSVGGGIAGRVSGGGSSSITNCFSTGNVSGGTVGGIAGNLVNSTKSVSNSYATGEISSNFGNGAGGVVGSNSGVVTNSYWNTTSSTLSNGVGSGSSTGITGLTSSEMRNVSSFTGFDFVNDWQNNAPNAYPSLQNVSQNPLPGYKLYLSNGSASLDGVNDWVDLPDSIAVALGDGSDMTMEAWVKLDYDNQADRGAGAIFSINSSSGANVLQLYVSTLLANYGQIRVFDGGDSAYEIGAPQVANDVWVHVAYTLEGTTGTYYLDGVLMGTHDQSTPLSTADQWSFGQEYDGSTASNFTKGLVDEIRVWNKARSQNEIQRDMFQQLTGDEDGLTTYIPFDVITGTNVLDQSSNGFNLSLEGGTTSSNETHPYGTFVTGNEGWRMMTSAAGNTSYGTLLDTLWTQGFTGADFTNGTSNVYTWSETTQAFASISNATDIPAAGSGFLVYVYDDDDFDGSADGFPKMIKTDSTQRTSAVSPTLSFTSSGTLSNDGWNLVGNPYGATIDWDASSGLTSTNLDDSFYVWSDSANSGAGDYLSWNGATGTFGGGEIAPWQGFWVKANAASPTLSLNNEIRSGGGILRKKTPVFQLRFTLKGETLSSKTILMFSDNASPQKDRLDAYKLQSLNGDYLSLFTQLKDGSGLDINALPIAIEEALSIPLEIDGSDLFGDFKLSWSPTSLPEGMTLTLVDTDTGTEVDLAEASSYSFEIERQAKVIQGESEESTPSRTQPIHGVFSPKVMKAKSSTSDARFIITISTGTSVSNEPIADLPQTVELDQNYPNPFNPSTTIAYGVPQTGKVTLEIFDVLGRKVATLLNGERKSAGRYTVNFNASNLASGMYIYRLQAGNVVLIKKLTLIK